MGLINRLGIGILLIGVGLGCQPAKGQAISWEIAAETGLITSGGGALPLWLHANSWGSVDPAGTNGYLQLESSFQVSLRNSWSWETSTHGSASTGTLSAWSSRSSAKARCQPLAFQRSFCFRMCLTVGEGGARCD